MQTSLRLLPLAALLALPGALRAQNDLSNYSATGRGGVINTFAQGYQAIGVNPANLGRTGEAAVSFTIAEIGAGVGSRSLSQTLLKNMVNNIDQPIGKAEKDQLVDGLTGENALNLNIDGTTFGMAISLPNGLGGLAFSNRVRVNSHIGLNRNAADILVNGQNAAVVRQYYPVPNTSGTTAPTNPNAPLISTVLDGTSIQLSATSEYNVSYGLRVLDKPGLKASVGVGYRYIQGLGIADIRAEEGSLYAFTALSPVFEVDYTSLANNPNFNNVKDSGLFDAVGKGHGFDFGVALEVGKMLQLGASVTDVGSMNWTGNVVTANDQRLKQTNSQGVDTYNVFEEIVKQFDTDEQTLFTYEAARERKSSLPGKVRLGAGLRISTLFETAVDVTLPLNNVSGNIVSPFVGLGVDFKPTRWLRLSSGVAGGAGYGTNLPVGVALVTPVWEFGLSSRDILGYTSEKSPYYSAAFGFLRFKIGGKS